MMHLQRDRRLIPGLVLGVAALTTMVGCSTPDRVVADGSDRLPNQSASDWVTYADHVVVVRATSETALDPDKDDQENGEGYIPREVTLQVEEVAWSRNDATKAAPKDSFTWDAFGWSWQDGKRIPMAPESAPRIEVGHTYIMAIVWQPAVDEDGDKMAAHWDGLGADSTLPYDGNVIGQGESEGAVQSTPPEPAPTDDPNYSLEDAMSGKTVDDLVAELNKAKPEPRESF